MATEVDRSRIVLYPAYLNSNLKASQGRRLPKAQACDDPSAVDMAEVAAGQLGLETALEDKRYPRDFWQRGRIRVRLADLSGGPANPAVPTKKALMAALAAAIPALPGYKARKAEEAKALASWNKAAVGGGPQGGGGGSGGGGAARPAPAAAPAKAGAAGRTSSKKKGRK